MKLKRFFVLFAFFITIFPNAVLFYGAPKLNMVLKYDNQTIKYDAEEINLYINGKKTETREMPPIILNKRTLVPAREIFEPLGAVIDWKSETRQVYVGYKDTLVILTIDDVNANIDGSIYKMDIPPKIINSKTMIPLGFVAEAIGLNVGWNGVDRIITIDEKVETKLPSDTDTIKPSVPDDASDDVPDNKTSIVDSSMEIKEENHPTTDIVNIQTPGNEIYEINATSAISKVERMVLTENRLVIDIYNSNMSMVQTTFTPESANLKSIRASQFELQPQRITRIVFDLKESALFNISMSADRKKILVGFNENKITGVDFDSDNDSDYILITGDRAPNVSVFKLDNPKRVVIDIPFTECSIGEKEMDVNGVFANTLRIGFPEEKTTRVVIDLETFPDYAVVTKENTTIVQLRQHTYANVDYNNGSGIVLSKITLNKNGNTNIDINKIIHTDEYNSLYYKLTFPGNFSSLFGYGEMKINDGYINSVIIQNNADNNTEIIINETNIYAYDITEDLEHIYINVMKPRSKYSKVLVLDAGHGGHDKGSGTKIHHGVYESYANLDILKKVYTRLEQDKIVKVYATRLTDTYPTNPSRAQMANDIADIFVSIHFNSLENQQITGTETLYATRVTENNLVCKKMAEIFQKNIVQAIGTIDRGLKLRKDLIVLNQTRIPAVLLEIAFISNYAEAQRVKTESFQNAVADAVCKSIYEAFDIYQR